MWEIVPWIVPRPWKSYAVRKNLQNFSEAAAAAADAEEAEGRGVQQALHCLLLSLSSQCLRPLFTVFSPKGALHPCHVSRGVRFELLVNEANPVLGLPRTTKVSETPLKLKNAPLLKCCQPACLNHLSALNAQELFATDLMPPLLKP